MTHHWSPAVKWSLKLLMQRSNISVIELVINTGRGSTRCCSKESLKTIESTGNLSTLILYSRNETLHVHLYGNSLVYKIWLLEYTDVTLSEATRRMNSNAGTYSVSRFKLLSRPSTWFELRFPSCFEFFVISSRYLTTIINQTCALHCVYKPLLFFVFYWAEAEPSLPLMRSLIGLSYQPWMVYCDDCGAVSRMNK